MRGLHPCPRDSTTHQGPALSSLGRQELEQKKSRGKEIAPPCVDASPGVSSSSSCRRKAGTAWPSSAWKERCLAPLQMPVLPLLDLLLIPPCECWVLGRAAAARGARGGCRDRGAAAGLPFLSPARAEPPSRAERTELVASVESVKLYSNQPCVYEPINTMQTPRDTLAVCTKH